MWTFVSSLSFCATYNLNTNNYAAVMWLRVNDTHKILMIVHPSGRPCRYRVTNNWNNTAYYHCTAVGRYVLEFEGFDNFYRLTEVWIIVSTNTQSRDVNSARRGRRKCENFWNKTNHFDESPDLCTRLFFFWKLVSKMSNWKFVETQPQFASSQSHRCIFVAEKTKAGTVSFQKWLYGLVGSIQFILFLV